MGGQKGSRLCSGGGKKNRGVEIAWKREKKRQARTRPMGYRRAVPLVTKNIGAGKSSKDQGDGTVRNKKGRGNPILARTGPPG